MNHNHKQKVQRTNKPPIYICTLELEVAVQQCRHDCHKGMKRCKMAMQSKCRYCIAHHICAKKLFFSLVALAMMLRNLLPEGRGSNSPCAGWVGSFIMLVMHSDTRG